MARPNKQGLDYFPMDVALDDKFELIEAKYGLEGFGAIIKLLQKIYANGYWYKLGEKEGLLFSNRLNVDINRLNVIINDCLRWKLFDQEIFDDFGVLTSRGIQKRYFEAVKRRKNVEIISEYLLCDPKIPEINVIILEINAHINPQNARNKKQSKVKESKGKKKESTRACARYDENSDEFSLVSLLIKAISTFKRDAKKPTPAQQQNWCQEIHLMITRDKRSIERTKAIIKWLPTDYHPGEKWKGWAPNILSATKLREKWDKLDLAEQDSRKKSNKSQGTQSHNFNEYNIMSLKKEIEQKESLFTLGKSEKLESELAELRRHLTNLEKRKE